MVSQNKISLLSDFSLECFDGGILKLFNLAALNANQMIMVVTPIHLEHGVAALKMMADDQPCRLELSEDAIDRGQTDLLTLADQGFEDFFCTQVTALGPLTLQNFQDLDSGEGDLKSRISDVFAFQYGNSGRCFTRLLGL